MARFWVAGASGFLGSHLVLALKQAGHEIVAVSRKGGTAHGITVQPLDVLDEAAVADSARGAEGAFLAFGAVSREPDDAALLHQVHVVGMRRVLAGLKRAGVPRVVHTSTSGTIAVGSDPDYVFDETDPTPLELIARWPYYRAKLYGEREALEANRPGEFEVLCANPSLLLGPGDERESSTADIRRFLDREVPAIPSGGVSIVDVRDVARALLSAFQNGRPGERYLLNAKNLTVAQLFKKLEAISGVPGPRLKLPRSRALSTGLDQLFRKAVNMIGGQVPVDETTMEFAQYYWYCDAAKAERELGFAPRDPAVTLRDTVADIRGRRGARWDGSNGTGFGATEDAPGASIQARASRVRAGGS